MPIVKVGDQRVKFPDSMSQEEIASVLSQQFQQPKQELDPGMTAKTISALSPIAQGLKYAGVVDDPAQSIEAGLIAAGRGMTGIARAVGLADEEDPTVTRQFEQLERERPTATTIGEIAGQTAPFLAPASAVGAIPSLGARVLASGALGATEGGLISRAEGRSGQEQLQSAGIGGTIAGGLELVLPRISRIGRQVYRRVTGKNPTSPLINQAGEPTQEFIEALKTEGKSFDDVVRQVNDELADEFVSPEDIARKTFLESQGLEPTRAQVSRSAADFQAQQEAAKTSSRVRDALEAQEAVLTTRFNNAVLDTGGRPVTPTNTVVDALTDKATSLDQKISDLYSKARQAAPGEKNIRMESTANMLKKLAPQNRRAGGNIEAIVGDLQEKGVLDKKMNVVGRIDVETAEDVRKLTNELYDQQNSFGNIKLREIKQAIDDDVFKAAGQDVFREARLAKREFEEGLSRSKISKFDSRKQNIVRDILENKISPDELSNKVVFGKSWRADDLEQLKNYISDSEAGQQAFNDLRADVLDTIKNRAFIGPEDAMGNKALSRDKLEKALAQIGDKKLGVIFTPEERRFLKDMVQVSKLREPVRGTQQGRGPSAQAISRLEQKLKDLPILGALVDFIDFDNAGRAVLKASPQRKAIEAPLTSGIIPQAGALTAISAQNEQ